MQEVRVLMQFETKTDFFTEIGDFILHKLKYLKAK